MPQILDRVQTNIQCCGIEVTFDGDSVPSTVSGWQPFYNETFLGATFQKAYAGIASIDFTEESVTTTSGTYFIQKVNFRFPATDSHRAERIVLLHKIKFLKVLLTNGGAIVIGRNDIAQNAKPTIKTKSNQHLCGIEIETKSISPAGFTPNFNDDGSPIVIPLTMAGFYKTFTYSAGDPQTFDLEAIVIPTTVVLGEGKELKNGTEWTLAGTILTITYDSLVDGDTIYVSGIIN